MKVLDLFSGIGGFSLGLEAAGMETVAFCEKEPFCKAVLKKHWPDVPCHDDIKTFQPEKGSADVVTGGYPCQPFSQAGRRSGHQDERHLWPEMLRVIRGVRPRWVIAENVIGHISLGFDEVAASLENENFTVWPFIIPACAVDAPHRRYRVWIVAHANSEGSQRRNSGKLQERSSELSAGKGGSFLDNTLRGRHGIPERKMQTRRDITLDASGWKPESNVGRVVNGLPRRVDRLRALGNSIVPQVAQKIGLAIMEHEHAA
jgi:DNA (cytosine-5)-methyltransferase 1